MTLLDAIGHFHDLRDVLDPHNFLRRELPMRVLELDATRLARLLQTVDESVEEWHERANDEWIAMIEGTDDRREAAEIVLEWLRDRVQAHEADENFATGRRNLTTSVSSGVTDARNLIVAISPPNRAREALGIRRSRSVWMFVNTTDTQPRTETWRTKFRFFYDLATPEQQNLLDLLSLKHGMHAQFRGRDMNGNSLHPEILDNHRSDYAYEVARVRATDAYRWLPTEDREEMDREALTFPSDIGASDVQVTPAEKWVGAAKIPRRLARYSSIWSTTIPNGFVSQRTTRLGFANSGSGWVGPTSQRNRCAM